MVSDPVLPGPVVPDPGSRSPHAVGTVAGLAVTQRRVIRSEWIKLRSVRSWTIMTVATAVLMIAFGALAASVASGAVAPGRPAAAAAADPFASTDPTAISLAGVTLAQLIVGVLGVLFISNEYANGHDPQHLRRRAATAAGAVGEGDRARRRRWSW